MPWNFGPVWIALKSNFSDDSSNFSSEVILHFHFVECTKQQYIPNTKQYYHQSRTTCLFIYIFLAKIFFSDLTIFNCAVKLLMLKLQLSKSFVEYSYLGNWGNLFTFKHFWKVISLSIALEFNSIKTFDNVISFKYQYTQSNWFYFNSSVYISIAFNYL